MASSEQVKAILAEISSLLKVEPPYKSVADFKRRSPELAAHYPKRLELKHLEDIRAKLQKKGSFSPAPPKAWRRGPKPARALSDKEILQRAAKGETVRAIAKDAGVSHTVVHRVIQRQSDAVLALYGIDREAIAARQVGRMK